MLPAPCSGVAVHVAVWIGRTVAVAVAVGSGVGDGSTISFGSLTAVETAAIGGAGGSATPRGAADAPGRAVAGSRYLAAP